MAILLSPDTAPEGYTGEPAGNPYAGTGGTSTPDADSPYGKDNPSTVSQLAHDAVLLGTGWTGQDFWGLAKDAYTETGDTVKEAINGAETKLEQTVAAGQAAVKDGFANVKDIQDKANTSLEYVAIIAAILAGVYVLSLAAPFLPRGK